MAGLLEPTAGKLHLHPVRRNGMVLDKVDNSANVHVAGLDHLCKHIALLERGNEVSA